MPMNAPAERRQFSFEKTQYLAALDEAHGAIFLGRAEP
jgi:hypothetical protein